MTASNVRARTPGLESLFKTRGWPIFDFQRQAWQAYANEESGLIHAPTGSGKTLAAWGGPLNECLDNSVDNPGNNRATRLSYLWITPLRALANDTTEQLNRPLAGLGFDWRVATRTGDTTAAERRRISKKPPPALVTTPESLSLMLSYADSAQRLGRLRGVIVDEWHELLGSKRGVLLELTLSRLRAMNPKLRIWGLSATLGNVDEARAVLLGPNTPGRLIAGNVPREIEVETLLPPSIERFPWAGRTGLPQLPGVLKKLESAQSTLLFTNTRSQSELWFQAIQSVVPWPDRVLLHHGSIDRKARTVAEQRLRQGDLKCVVATSSLDLGVDFSPVDQVLQIGSPKGIARLIQRAGRSGHRPGQTSKLVCVPTHALEILEIAAARRRIDQRRIEARRPLAGSLDVAAQHLVTRALGGGFTDAEALAELRDTHAFANLGDDEWGWLKDFILRGGPALKAYPGFQKVELDDGTYRVPNRRIASLHRMSVGTITADGHLRVRFMKGASLGQIEERFITRLKPGEKFVFAGRLLTLAKVKDMTAYVKKASGGKAAVPRWAGGRLPLSTLLADAVLELMDEADHGKLDSNLEPITELLDLQKSRSALPTPDRLLIECIKSREGHHLYLFPFAGRLAHEGLAALIAWRLADQAAQSYSMTVNDYGIELVGDNPFELTEADCRRLLSPENLEADLLSALNAAEMARHRFRDIARISGLVFQGYPGRSKATRQIQASSGLMFDMLSEHDPDNLLLKLARREVLESEMELSRIEATLRKTQTQSLMLREPGRLTPLAFPLWADRLRSRVSSEDFERRVERMLAMLEPSS